MSKFTTKTLQQLNELMQSENLAYKKCCNYLSSCTDATLKDKINKYAAHHKSRFDALMNLIEN